MASTKLSKKKPEKEYAGLMEDIRRQVHTRTDRKQAKKRPKMSEALGDKMNALRQEEPCGTAAVAPQQPTSAATDAGQALAEQWQKEVGTAGHGGGAQVSTAHSSPGSKGSATGKRELFGLLQCNRAAMLVACVIIVAVVFLVTVTGVFVGITVVRKWEKTCRTEGCRMYSEAFLASMDTSANPCEDFSQYVCGRYSNPRNLSTIRAALLDFRLELVHAAQNETLMATGQNQLQKTLRFFKSCVDVVDTDSVNNVATVLDGLRDAGIRWPSPRGADADTLVEAMVLFSEHMGWPSLLDFVIEHGVHQFSQVTILPSRLSKFVLSLGSSFEKREGFRSFFSLLVSHYERAAENTTDDIVTFEEVMSAQQRRISFQDYFAVSDEPVLFTNNTERSISTAVNALKRALSKLPWKTLRLAGLTFRTEHWKLVYNVLSGIVKAPRDFELIMAWHVAYYLAPITNRELAVAYHDFSVLRIATAYKHRRFCFINTIKFFGVATFSLYVKEHFTEPVRQQVETMAKNTRRAYFATLTDSTYDWASLANTLVYLTRSQSTRVREILDDVGDIGFDIVANYRAMTVAYTKVGEDMAWLLGSELETGWTWPFKISEDVLMLPWALSFPFYREDVPAYLRYGAFAMSFARSTVALYAKHKSKTLAQYGNCCERSFSPKPPTSHIHYSSAFDASVNLYQDATRSDGKLKEESLLPGLPKMSPLQLFFVAGCYLHCELNTEQVLCNRILRWNAAFREAFQCKPGSPMLANETCTMFGSTRSSPIPRASYS